MKSPVFGYCGSGKGIGAKQPSVWRNFDVHNLCLAVWSWTEFAKFPALWLELTMLIVPLGVTIGNGQTAAVPSAERNRQHNEVQAEKGAVEKMVGRAIELIRLGKLVEAEPLFKEALAMREKLFGNDSL